MRDLLTRLTVATWQELKTVDGTDIAARDLPPEFFVQFDDLGRIHCALEDTCAGAMPLADLIASMNDTALLYFYTRLVAELARLRAFEALSPELDKGNKAQAVLKEVGSVVRQVLTF